MHRHEQVARRHRVGDDHLQFGETMRGGDAGDPALGEPQTGRVVGMDLHEGHRPVGREALALPRPGHGVPVVAHPAGVQHEGILTPRRLGEAGGLHGDEAGPAVEGVEPPVREEARLALPPALPRQGPLHRVRRGVGVVRDVGEGADVEIAGAVVLEGREAGMFAEHGGGALEGEGLSMTEPPPDLRQHRPIGPCLAGARQEAALAGDPPLGIRDGAVLLAPALGGQQQRGARPRPRRVGIGHDVGDDEEVQSLHRRADMVRPGHRHEGVRAHHPQSLDLARAHRLEQGDGLHALAGNDARRAPVAAHPVHLLGSEMHMRGEHVRQPADLAPAHGVGLAGEGERPLPHPADPAGDEVAIDDRVALVGALHRLVHAHGEGGDDPARPGEQVVEGGDVGLRQPRRDGNRREVGGDLPGAVEGGVEARRVLVHEGAVAEAVIGEMDEEAGEQGDIASRLQPEEQVGSFRGLGAAGVDDDELGAVARLGVGHAAEQDRVAPRRVRADEHDEVGLVEILVATGHRVRAEGPAVGRHRARHAQARIGLDMRGADEALRELVGDVIILRQQLAGEVEGDRLRPVGLRDPGHLGGGGAERRVPGDPRAVELRVEQAVLQGQGLAERRALGAEAAEIGGMFGIARDGRAPLPVRRREHAAADAAIRAGGADRGIHGGVFQDGSRL